MPLDWVCPVNPSVFNVTVSTLLVYAANRGSRPTILLSRLRLSPVVGRAAAGDLHPPEDFAKLSCGNYKFAEMAAPRRSLRDGIIKFPKRNFRISY
jgi:hypothetical protein